MSLYKATYAEVVEYLTRRQSELDLARNSPNACDRQASADILPMVETVLQWVETGNGVCPSYLITAVLGNVHIYARDNLTLIYPEPGKENPTPLFDLSQKKLDAIYILNAIYGGAKKRSKDKK